MNNLTKEQIDAISSLRQIKTFIEMYAGYLLQEPWVEIDFERLEKMESAFYLLQDEFALKLERIESVFGGGGEYNE